MVTDGPLPMSVRGDAERWAGCVHGALPEGEYLDLIRAAGFTDVRANRSLSGGAIEGVSIYSVSVSARKGRRADPVTSDTPVPAATTPACGCSGS